MGQEKEQLPVYLFSKWEGRPHHQTLEWAGLFKHKQQASSSVKAFTVTFEQA